MWRETVLGCIFECSRWCTPRACQTVRKNQSSGAVSGDTSGTSDEMSGRCRVDKAARPRWAAATLAATRCRLSSLSRALGKDARDGTAGTTGSTAAGPLGKDSEEGARGKAASWWESADGDAQEGPGLLLPASIEGSKREEVSNNDGREEGAVLVGSLESSNSAPVSKEEPTG